MIVTCGISDVTARLPRPRYPLLHLQTGDVGVYVDSDSYKNRTGVGYDIIDAMAAAMAVTGW